MKAARKLRRMQQPRTLMEYVRQFLTPQVWKQARQAVPSSDEYAWSDSSKQPAPGQSRQL
jgi:hypothetical protein